MFYKIVLLLFTLTIASCKCQKQTSNSQNEFKVVQEEVLKHQEVSYRRWVAGIQGGGSGITIFIDLKEPLNQNLTFKKVQITTFESSSIEKIDDLHYVAHVKTYTNDLKLDENPKEEYGNEIPPKSDVNLKEGQVKIFFTKNGKSGFQLVEGVQEKEMLAYPSMRPQNDEEKQKN